MSNNQQDLKDSAWAFLRGLVKGGTLGTSKYAGAAARYALNSKIDPQYTWEDALRDESDYQKSLEIENPNASLAGNLVGTLVPGVMSGGGGVVPMVAKGAAMGGVQGFTQNDGMKDVKQDVGLGVLLGGAGGGVGAGIEKGLVKVTRNRIGAANQVNREAAKRFLTTPNKDLLLTPVDVLDVITPGELRAVPKPKVNEDWNSTFAKRQRSELSKLSAQDIDLIKKGNPAEYEKLVAEDAAITAANKQADAVVTKEFRNQMNEAVFEDIARNPENYVQSMETFRDSVGGSPVGTWGKTALTPAIEATRGLEAHLRGLIRANNVDEAIVKENDLRQLLGDYGHNVRLASYRPYSAVGQAPKALEELKSAGRDALTGGGLGFVADYALDRYTGKDGSSWIPTLAGAVIGGGRHTKAFSNSLQGLMPALQDKAVIGMFKNPTATQSILGAPTYASTSYIPSVVDSSLPVENVDVMPWETQEQQTSVPDNSNLPVILPGKFNNGGSNGEIGYQVPPAVQAQRDDEAARILQAERNRAENQDETTQESLKRELGRKGYGVAPVHIEGDLW